MHGAVPRDPGSLDAQHSVPEWLASAPHGSHLLVSKLLPASGGTKRTASDSCAAGTAEKQRSLSYPFSGCPLLSMAFGIPVKLNG